MIQYLNKLRRKRGFTFVELVVVLAIIGVLIGAMTVSMLSGTTQRIQSANANAEVFFSASQLMFTRAQLTERSLVEYGSSDTKFIEYKNGVNTTNGKYLFLEAKCEQRGIIGVHIDNTLNALMSKPDITGTGMTALESYFAKNIDQYLTDSYEGYFYAAVDENFRVFFTHFCPGRLPTYSGSLSDFRDAMMVSNGKLVGTGHILGSWSDEYISPETGEYAFALPDTSDTKYNLYLA